ncbi:MAG: hypothetical protein L6R38_003280 [Xanthoria sp. 2 TBL-2021]|nr:MAG: hypothetical protein L6R38_003280 [Xanthoria sp. 2 TBL-2021]
MSLLEIEQKIKDLSLTPTLLSAGLMKQITWADQWIGYDDAETIALKKAWADGQCFGGTMTWSVDFNSVATLPQIQQTTPAEPPTKALSAAPGHLETAAPDQVIVVMAARAETALSAASPPTVPAESPTDTRPAEIGVAVPIRGTVGTQRRFADQAVRVVLIIAAAFRRELERKAIGDGYEREAAEYDWESQRSRIRWVYRDQSMSLEP